jgi:hypothetical protein
MIPLAETQSCNTFPSHDTDSANQGKQLIDESLEYDMFGDNCQSFANTLAHRIRTVPGAARHPAGLGEELTQAWLDFSSCFVWHHGSGRAPMQARDIKKYANVLLKLLVHAAVGVAMTLVGSMVAHSKPMVETLMTWWWENNDSLTAWFLELAEPAIKQGWVILHNGYSLFSGISDAILHKVLFRGVINVVTQPTLPLAPIATAAVILTAGGYWLWKWYWSPATDKQVMRIALHILHDRTDEVVTLVSSKKHKDGNFD